MKRIYMAGCGGMLGEAFFKVFNHDYDLMCTDIDVNDPWLSYCDFRDFDEYRRQVIEFKPDFLFHLGAYTDLEFCELNIDDTYATNTMSVENATYIANELKIPLLYISTAGIFDGSKDTFDDYDFPNPMCHYARSKYMGELFVRENVQQHLICRAGWMMGGGPAKDKKFVQKIMQKIKLGDRELYIVNDKLGTPTLTYDFAANTRLLIEKRYWGLYNMVCGGVTSRLEVAQEIIKIIGIEDEVNITEVGSDFFKEEYFAPRPLSERLINKKLSLRNANIMRDWRVCLLEYMNMHYLNYVSK